MHRLKAGWLFALYVFLGSWADQSVSAETQNLAGEKPLSAIEWLSRIEPTPPGKPLALDLSPVPPAENIVLRELSARRLDGLGLISAEQARLPRDIWRDSHAGTVSMQLNKMEMPDLGVLRDYVVRMVVAELDPPDAVSGEDGEFLAARARLLLRWGHVELAEALLSRAGPETPELTELWFDAAILAGNSEYVCQVLNAKNISFPSKAHEIFCLAREDRWEEAVQAFENASDIPEHVKELIAHFLDPEYSDDMDGLASTDFEDAKPLEFKLLEAVGAPQQTSALPLEYAFTDLRDVAGWKAQLEATERLARAGALSGNQWRGIVLGRRPSASGGIWDRVAAYQALEAALSDRMAIDHTAIELALEDAILAANASNILPFFAEHYGQRLLELPPSDRLLPENYFELAMLSTEYRRAIERAPLSAEAQFLASVGEGIVDKAGVSTFSLGAIVMEAFSQSNGDSEWLSSQDEGEELLAAIEKLSDGLAADPRRIREGLFELRRLGMPELARRAALELLVLSKN